MWDRIKEIKTILDTQHANGEETSSILETEISKLSRENLKLCEDITGLLKAGDNENSIVGSLGILKALRQSTENDPIPPRGASTGKIARGKNRKQQDSSSVLSADDRESLTAEPPTAVASPKVLVPNSTRLKASSSSRAGSVPVGREASVKVEEGTESGADAGKCKSCFHCR